MKYLIDTFIGFSVAVIIILAVTGLCSIIKDTYTTSPVENCNEITTLITTNDSIKLEINSLDSIKNAKVLEIKSLDSDSTVKLFYKLVSE